MAASQNSLPLDNKSSPPETRLHLAYLDGIRALAALYVVHFHILSVSGVGTRGEGLARQLASLFAYGHYPVVIFIVLSGYCLMMPVARSGGQLKGGFRNYVVRRARRILPPYYAVLVFCAALLLVYSRSNHEGLNLHYSKGAWLSHLLLVHNLRRTWIYSINGPMWSIATEWQIYFLFPLFLLPVWRRWGNSVCVSSGLALGLLLWLSFPSITKAAPWFIGLFAMGMAASAINFDPRYEDTLEKWPWKALALMCFGLSFGLVRFVPYFTWYEMPGSPHSFYPFSDLILGGGTAALLIGCTRRVARGTSGVILQLFSWPPLVFLGTFSYSIYLIHYPILMGVSRVIRHFDLPHALFYTATLGIVVPLSLLCGYGCFLAFEKPFMGSHQRAQKSAPNAPPSPSAS